MAKKKQTKNNKFISALSVILGLVSLGMIFAPAIIIKNSETTFTGFQVAFGYKESTLLGDFEYFNFSLMNVLAYVIVAAGIVFTILGSLGKGNKFASFLAFLGFAISAVLFFMQVFLCVPNQGLEKLVKTIGNLLGEKASIKDSLSLAYGSIVSGACAVLAMLFSAYKTFKK